MSILGGLLLFPVTGPLWGFRMFAERLRDEAEAVLFDEGRAVSELLQLSMRHRAGMLSDEEFAEQETALLEHLRAIRDYREEQLDAELGDEEEEEWYLDGDPEMNEDTLPDAAVAEDFAPAEAEPDVDEVTC